MLLWRGDSLRQPWGGLSQRSPKKSLTYLFSLIFLLFENPPKNLPPHPLGSGGLKIEPSFYTFTNLLSPMFLTPYFSIKLDSLTLIYCNKDQLVIFVFEEFFVKCIVSPHLWLSRAKPQAKSLYIKSRDEHFL